MPLSTQQRLTLIGAPGSPYTHKMIALLRYRQIPYQVIWGQPSAELDKRGIASTKVELLPTFIFNDDNGEPQAVLDSTPIIRRLETQWQERSVIPNDPVLAFIDYLIEDFADEWATKYMFHYRWHGSVDADNAGSLLPFGLNTCLPDEQQIQFKKYFSERQISRLYVVGSNDVTAPVIDASYRRFLKALSDHLSDNLFILGKRPSACDFALYGQLTQLVGFDPTPRSIAEADAPRVVAWVQRMSDLSGCQAVENGWHSSDSITDSLTALLNEMGRVYAPALMANARALQAGEKTWQATIDGALWTQQSFPYQGKCLQSINQAFADLSSSDQDQVLRLLNGTGCETLISSR
jgi:glutathione S-transferase